MKLFKILGLTAVLAVPASVAGAAPADHSSRPNVLAIADTAGNFQTLLIAANNAGVLGTLVNPLERVTLLAPTDEAFAKLPRGTLDYLMLPENKDKLADLVKRHIVPGAVLAASFESNELELTTLAGTQVELEGKTAGGAKIEYTDVVGSNGVIHVIDKVLVPDRD